MLVEGSSQSGNYRVDMEEGDNRLSFYVTDSLGNIRTFGKDVHVDVTAPQLSVLRDLNGQSTSENHVFLEGHTEGGAVLTLNGKTVDTQNGYFSIPLSPGRGKDPAGAFGDGRPPGTSQSTARWWRGPGSAGRF